jgi:MFS family permease
VQTAALRWLGVLSSPDVIAAAGNLAGLALAPVLLHTVGWRGLFYVFGLLGLPLLALWLKVVPKQTPKPRTDGQGVEKLSAVKMMSNSATWAIIAVNFVNHWGELRRWGELGGVAIKDVGRFRQFPPLDRATADLGQIREIFTKSALPTIINTIIS